jgi:hypothetical protein
MEISVMKTFTDTKKKELIEEWRQSGKTKLCFCKEKGLKYFTFVRWCSGKRRIRKSTASPSFLPVKISRHPDALFAQLTLRDGAVLNIYQPVEASYLSALVQ